MRKYVLKIVLSSSESKTKYNQSMCRQLPAPKRAIDHTSSFSARRGYLRRNRFV